MNTFALSLHSVMHDEYLVNVRSFIGTDASGKFGIMANHCRMMTCVNFSLSKITYENSTIEYLALPKGIVYFINNVLHISARNYYRRSNYSEIIDILDNQLRNEEKSIIDINETLNRLDEMILKRLWEIEQAEKL